MMEKMSKFSRSASFSPTTSFTRSRSFNRSQSLKSRTLSVTTPTGCQSSWVSRVSLSSWVSRWFNTLIVTGIFISFLIALYGSYLYVMPSLNLTFHGYGVLKHANSISSCDVFDGSWVFDDNYPLYNATECPFVEQGFNCLANGRRDKHYLKYSWKPNNCDIPRFDVPSILEKLRGKRVVFVGDSMSRTQWESLICLLMTGVEDKKSVYEVNGNKITKQIRYLSVRFSSFNFTLEFFRSVFLVQHGWLPRHAPKRVKSILKLDKLDDISNQWINSDILIFNTGQWWVPEKLFDLGCYFQFGNSLKLGMSIPTAFRTALDTWASWVEEKIDTNRTRVFFRTFEPSHWSDPTRRFCNVTLHPMVDTRNRDKSIFSDTVHEVVKNMTINVAVLHVTSMSSFRSDAHVGNWSDKPSFPDCSHWCLPGLPDVWNEILLFYLPYDKGHPSLRGFYQKWRSAAAAAGVLSKSAQKKLLKQQRWEAKKAEKKAKEKEQKKREGERKRKEWEETLASLTEEEKLKMIESRKSLRKERMEKRSEERDRKNERLNRAKESGQKVVIDLELSHLMTPSEMNSLVHQIMYCYAENGRSSEPCHLWLTGCKGEMGTQLRRLPGFDNWSVEREDRSYIEALEGDKESLVYLTADSENVVDELDRSKIYVIGGLVDRNRWKGITMKKAEEQGIQTAKLPIGKYLNMCSSQVLTVNQVLEILLKYLETKDWKASFFQVIPQRKRFQAAEDSSEEVEGKEKSEEQYESKKQCANGPPPMDQVTAASMYGPN